MHVIVAVTIMSIVYMQLMHGADAEQAPTVTTVMVAPQQVLPPYPWGRAQKRQFIEEYNPACCSGAPQIPMISPEEASSCEHRNMSTVAWLMNHGCRITSCCQGTAAVTIPATVSLSILFCEFALNYITEGGLFSCMNIPTTAQFAAVTVPTFCCLCMSIVTLYMSCRHSRNEPCTYYCDHRIVRSLIAYNNWLADGL